MRAEGLSSHFMCPIAQHSAVQRERLDLWGSNLCLGPQNSQSDTSLSQALIRFAVTQEIFANPEPWRRECITPKEIIEVHASEQKALFCCTGMEVLLMIMKHIQFNPRRWTHE